MACTPPLLYTGATIVVYMVGLDAQMLGSYACPVVAKMGNINIFINNYSVPAAGHELLSKTNLFLHL